MAPRSSGGSSTLYFGVDNGQSGAIGHTGDRVGLIATPTVSCLNFQKTKATRITRVDHEAFRAHIKSVQDLVGPSRCFALLENPATGFRGRTPESAYRALESTLVSLEILGIGYDFIAATKWQKALLPPLPAGMKTGRRAMLKQYSRDVGARMFPEIDLKTSKVKDYDGILIAEYAKRNAY